MPSFVFAASASPRQRVLMDAGWWFHADNHSPVLRGRSITTWRMRAASGGEDAVPVDTSGAGWTQVHTGDDTFHGQTEFQ